MELVINRPLCCVAFQLLVKHGGDLFAENENKDTPCDCAEKQHHKELALNLESRMVFSRDPEAESIEAEYAALDKKEVRGYFTLGCLTHFGVLCRVFSWQQFPWGRALQSVSAGAVLCGLGS